MAGFWKNKKVLVTGYEGFLGGHLTKELIASGAMVIGLDIKTKRKETILTQEDCRRIKIFQGDVADYSLVEKILKQNKIEIVFHLAAEALVGECLKKPLKAFESNIAGTWALLEAGRDYGKLKAIIIASSDKAYGSHKKLPYRENFPLAGNHPYDVSKSCADLLAHTYFHTYGLPVAVTRCGNIYGPGDFNFSRLVPDATRCAISGRTFNIRSDGQFTRDYVFVDDIVSGYLMLAEQLRKKKLAGEAFNFSDESPLTVLELVKKISAVLGKKPKYKILNQARYEIKDQFLSSTKARKVLGWRPKIKVEAGLERTVVWYRDYFINEKN
jgi:CDP-glucose 4,6-dehydratase